MEENHCLIYDLSFCPGQDSRAVIDGKITGIQTMVPFAVHCLRLRSPPWRYYANENTFSKRITIQFSFFILLLSPFEKVCFVFLTIDCDFSILYSVVHIATQVMCD